MKSFISHSSDDKEFVKEMIEYLGRDSVNFDQYSFQPGESLNKEIRDKIEESKIFVLLISQSSLNSKWVQEEIQLATKLMVSKELIFLPYCIDSSVKPKDTRLEEWIWEKLIKTFTFPKLLARDINRHRKNCIAQKFPDLASSNTLFMGRNIDMSNLEKSYYNEDLSKLKSIIISGFTFVGRRTLLKHFIYNYICKGHSDDAIVITLQTTNQLDQLLMQLNERVGLVKKEQIIAEISKGEENVRNWCIKELKTLIDYQEKIIIEDDACIVKPSGEIVSWFLDLLRSQELPNLVIFYVASRFRPIPAYVNDSDLLMEYPLKPLNRVEMESLFKACLRKHEIQLEDSCIQYYVDLFSGYPKQAIDAANIIKEKTAILARSTIEASKARYDNNYNVIWELLSSDCKDMLIMMSKFDFISNNLLLKIVGEEETIQLLKEIEPYSLYECFGSANEYLCLNYSFADYIIRSKHIATLSFIHRMREVTKELLSNIDTGQEDLSSHLYAIKECIRQNPKRIDERYLIPSFVLKVIVEEYHSGHDEIVVNIAERIIHDYKKANYQDCINHIHYWYCCSLCRLQQIDKFQNEVQYFENNQFDHSFLQGFFYRHNSKKDRIRRARQCYEYSLSIKDKRELKTITSIAKVEHEYVIVLLKLPDYKAALDTAKRNYENNPHNSYHIRAYFNCLINTHSSSSEELQGLITQMNSSGKRVASFFVPTMKLQCEFYQEQDFPKIVNKFTNLLKTDLGIGKKYAIESFREICQRRDAMCIFNEKVQNDNIDSMEDIED